MLISAHQCSSAYVVQSRDACLEKVEQSARRGEEHMHLWGEGGDGAVVSTCMLGERGEEHMHRSSAVMGGHGRSSEVISVHPRSSEVISGNHHPLGQPRDLHLPRRPPVHAGGLDAQGLTCGNSTRTQAHSGALRRTQAHSGALRRTQAHSDALRGTGAQGTRVQSAGFSPQSVRHQSAISPPSVAYQSGGTRPW